jgi:pyruvate ferredoxin oxidoreductase beta subunit
MTDEKKERKATPKIRPTDTIRDLKYIKAKSWPEEEYFVSGHRACQGCAEALAVRLVIKALGPDIVIANATGCMEIVSSPLPTTSWAVPWIHVAFENAAAVASGMESGLKVLMRKGRLLPKEIKAIAMAGDGGTADIGLQALSGALERGHNMIYFCFDNEAYMNTGIQRSSYPYDLYEKVKKAQAIKGPSYIHILSVCPTGWRIPSNQAIRYGRLAAETGIFPIYEVVNGKYRITIDFPTLRPVQDYLQGQGRFRHLTPELINKIQERVTAEYQALKAKSG